MRTARLPTILVLVATTRCQYHEGMGPQVSKFEQVTSDDHQMSIAGGEGRSHFCYLGEGEEEVPYLVSGMGGYHVPMHHGY